MRIAFILFCLIWVSPVYANSISAFSPELSVEYFKGELNTNSPTKYFGTRDNGGGNQTLGVLTPDTDGRYRKTEFALRVPIPAEKSIKSQWDIFIKGGFGSADVTGTTQNFDAGAQAILIPGADLAGFTILGPNGVANRLSYNHDYSWAQGEIGAGKNFKLRSYFSIRPYGGVQYGHLNTNETFAGNLPIVIREFRYYTNINNDIISPFVGFESAFRPKKLTPSFPLDLEFFGSAQYTLNFNDAKGTDSLAFTGFATDEVIISENDESHNVHASLGVTVNPDGPFSLSVGGNYERVGNIPEIQRNGTANSNLSFGSANIWSGSVRATLKF